MTRWVDEGKSHIGLAEIPGKQHNPKILAWLDEIGAGWLLSDEAPWCGTFVAHCCRFAGLSVPRDPYRAKSWAAWGQALNGAFYGCVVVFERTGGGHVGFAVGRDQDGRLMVLGGNQGNKVSIAPFDGARVIAYRWPLTVPLPELTPLPVIQSNASASANEA